MSDSNKILTVSYGTFSCTLEGFDDPFGTMRGIAEYFRDLAAEDRYFGAEPPTPDVEMLQSIAERDVKRRVEARIGETGIALRAEEPVEDAELSEPPVDEAPEVEKETPQSDEAATSETPVEDMPAVEDEGAATEEPAPAEAPAPVEATEIPDTAPLAFDDDYLMADEPEDVLTIDVEARPITSGHAPESIAEKLRRIRAVVSRNIEPEPAAFPDLDEDEDDAASPFAQPAVKRERALTETLASISADLSEDDEIGNADTIAEEDAAVAPDAPLDEAVALDEQPDATDASAEDEIADDQEPVSLDEMPWAAAEDTADDGEAMNIAAEIEDEFEDEFDDMLEDTIFDEGLILNEEAETPAETAPEEGPLEDEAIAPAYAGITQPETVEEDRPDLEEELPEEIVAVEDPAAAEPVEDDEDKDAQSLANVLAEVMGGSASEDDADAEDEDLERPERRAAETLEPLSESNGNVGRLLQETDQQFADDEGVRRRRVISQMRAAVAATKADRFFSRIISPEEKAEAEQSPYRRDLNRVITSDVVEEPPTAEPKPAAVAEPEPADATTPTLEPARKSAPLVLVSSQRVDTASTSGRPTSRPEPGSFAEFAMEMGAEELPDLLEAAAAYSAFVEGQPHFSRPDIMKRVARIDPALSLSREAGLRSFGMLLRQGKIQKLQRGQFTIAEDTKFNPAQRIAGE